MLPNFLKRLLSPQSAAVSIPDELWAEAVRKHPICHSLSPQLLSELRTRCGQLKRRIYIDLVPGVPDNEELRLSVLLQAALPILRLDTGWYRSVRTILLVPREYEIERSDVDEAGVVHEGTDTISGELGHQGPVVLSVADIEASGWGEGYNVVIHEMTHVLDATNGELDGAPAFPERMSGDQWGRVMTEAYNDHTRRVLRAERSESGGRRAVKPPVLDPYAAEGPEEFFACAAEIFFERPGRLRRVYPQVYEQFTSFFGFDPASKEQG